MEYQYENKTVNGFNVCSYPVADSTNIRLHKMAQDAPDMTVCIAGIQTNGRGRKDRKWLSKSGVGAWFSCLIKPEKEIPAVQAGGIVFMSALTVAKVLRRMTQADIRIKWPNDIVLNGKKICGIMCEMRTRETYINYAIAGIGVNLLDTDFPDDLPYASSVEKETGIRILPEEFLEEFLYEFPLDRSTWETMGTNEILKRIEPLSATLGKRVKAVSDRETIEGTAVGFTKDGSLRIQTETQERVFIAGDVSVRGVMGYSD